MKTLRVLIFPFAALAFSAAAQAVPVQYQLTAIAPDNTWDGFIFGAGDVLTAEFIYDADTQPRSQSDIPGESRTEYDSVISNFSATINGYSLDAADFNHTLVYDLDYGYGREKALSIMFNGVLPRTVINDYIYTVDSFRIGLSATESFESQLPVALALDDVSNAPAILYLSANSPNPETAYPGYNVEFRIATITAVPLPSTALFFLSALAGLGTNAVRKLKR